MVCMKIFLRFNGENRIFISIYPRSRTRVKYVNLNDKIMTTYSLYHLRQAGIMVHTLAWYPGVVHDTRGHISM